MTSKEKDEKIKRLLRLLDAARARNREQHKDFNAALAEIAKLEDNEQHRVRQLEEYKQMLASAVASEKELKLNFAYLEKMNKDLQSDVDKLRQLKAPESRDGVFIERLKRQHVVLLQLAAFTEGIMLAELVDNPSENLGYDMGRDRVRSFIMASEAIILEK